MWTILLTIFCVILAIGPVNRCRRAYLFWRSELPNAHKVAALNLVLVLVDLVAFAAFLFLWHNNFDTNDYLLAAGAATIGISYVIVTGFERKLLTGKASIPLDTPIFERNGRE